MGQAKGGPGPGGGDSGHRALNPAALLGVLAAHRVEFVIIGGFALAPHGYVRATKDIDIVPAPSPTNLARLAASLRDLKAEVDLGDFSFYELGLAPDEAGLRAGGNWVLQTCHGPLDVMQDVPGVRSYDELRAGAIEVAGALYAGYDQLIAMKVSSGREEDLRDIGALEAARRPPEDGR